MIKAIIIDDVKKFRITLRNDLQKYCPDVKIIAEAESVLAGIEIVEQYKPDVVFLDINLKGGTGFDILNGIKNIDFEIIFTTAYDQYAVKAFKYAALDYLLKPIDTAELVDAVNKLRTHPLHKDARKCLEVLMENTKSLLKPSQKIVLPASDGLHIYKIVDIIRLQAAENYTHIYLKNGEVLHVAKTLKYFEELLNDRQFERVHQSHIINIDAISKYVNRDGGYLVMTNNSKIPVAQRKKTTLLAKLEKINSGNY